MKEIAIYTQAQQLTVKEYQGERVITFKDVDTLHQRPEGTAGRNFRANRSRFIEGEDFFKITADEFRRAFGGMDTRQQMDVTLLTKMGYLMLVKSFTDDLAWMVQRQLVKSYFEAHPVEPSPAPMRALPTGKKPLPRVRTLPQAAKEIQAIDPSTSITCNRLRRWVLEGKIPSFNSGSRRYVNMDDLELLMEGGGLDGKH